MAGLENRRGQIPRLCLALSGSPANYAFAPTTYSYSGVTVVNAVASITVTPTGRRPSHSAA